MKEKIRIWIDMDGVLVKTISELEEYKNLEVFDNITSITGAKVFVSVLARFKEIYNFDLNICSKTYYPAGKEHERQKEGKKLWLKSRGIIHNCNTLAIMANDECKSTLVKSKYDILIDDYGKNCKAWQDAGGIAFQMFEEKEKEWTTAKTWTELISDLIFILERL